MEGWGANIEEEQKSDSMVIDLNVRRKMSVGKPGVEHSGQLPPEAQKTISFSTTLLAGSEPMFYCALPLPLSPLGLFDRDFSQLNALDRGPDDGQATHFGREHVNLVGTLTHVDFRDSQWHWWSEYSGAASVESHKR